MRASFISVLALASSAFMGGVLSAPTAGNVAEIVEKRQPVERRASFDALSLVKGLSSTLAPNIAALDAAAKSVTLTSSAADKDAASQKIKGIIAKLVASVDTAKAKVPTSSTKRDAEAESAAVLDRRQGNTQAIAQIILQILTAISNAANSIIASLGLTAALAFLNPLVLSLSGLLISLDGVVDQLLAVVKTLVDGLLIGLSAALAGLVL